MTNEHFINASDVATINGYYNWLLNMIDPKKCEDYSKLLMYLHNKEFYWTIANDDNRAADGINLRRKYIREFGLLGDGLMDKPCSVLEMLIALANRIDKDILPDEDGKEKIDKWFWIMIGNLGLDEFDNTTFSNLTTFLPNNLEKVVNDFLNRKYDKDGNGGLFPLKSGKVVNKNQKKEEIWYQMQEYIIENY